MTDEQLESKIDKNTRVVTPHELLERFSQDYDTLGYSPQEIVQCLSILAQTRTQNLFSEVADSYRDFVRRWRIRNREGDPEMGLKNLLIG